MKKKISIVLILVLSLITFFSLFCKVEATTVTNLAPRGVSWGGSKVGSFQIDGRQAFALTIVKQHQLQE